MKTKIRTLIAICVLGFFGILNINAIADNKKTVTTEVTTEKDEMLTNDNWMSDKVFAYSAEEFTTRDIEEEALKYQTTQFQDENSGIIPVSQILDETATVFGNCGQILNDKAFVYSAEEFTTRDIEEETLKYQASQFSDENSGTITDSQILDETDTILGTDAQIEKYAEKQITKCQTKQGE